VQDLANAVWADAGYGRHTEDAQLDSSFTNLLKAAGLQHDAECAATTYLTSVAHANLTVGDGKYTRDTVRFSIASFLDNQNPCDSAIRLLRDLVHLHGTDASKPATSAVSRPGS